MPAKQLSCAVCELAVDSSSSHFPVRARHTDIDTARAAVTDDVSEVHGKLTRRHTIVCCSSWFDGELVVAAAGSGPQNVAVASSNVNVTV